MERRQIDAEAVAVWLDVSPVRVGELVAAGRLPAPGPSGWDGLEIVGAVCALLRTGSSLPKREVERVKRWAAQRALLELQLLEKRGSLIPAAAVERRMERMAIEVRDALLAAIEVHGFDAGAVHSILRGFSIPNATP